MFRFFFYGASVCAFVYRTHDAAQRTLQLADFFFVSEAHKKHTYIINSMSDSVGIFVKSIGIETGRAVRPLARVDWTLQFIQKPNDRKRQKIHEMRYVPEDGAYVDYVFFLFLSFWHGKKFTLIIALLANVSFSLLQRKCSKANYLLICEVAFQFRCFHQPR